LKILPELQFEIRIPESRGAGLIPRYEDAGYRQILDGNQHQVCPP